MKEDNKSKSKYPSRDECIKIMQDYGTPERVIDHCMAVSGVARAIAVELNNKGSKLNIPLLISATSLHDIARVHSRHEKVGAEYLLSIGLDEVAKTIENHTFHKLVNKGFDITEEDLVCIADRLVVEDKFVGPEKRMDYIFNKAIKKFGDSKKSDLKKWKETFVEYIRDLENFIGINLNEIVPDEHK